MPSAETVLARIVEWAEDEPNVRALVLVGSRAAGADADDLADIDLRIYAKTTELLVEEDEWLSAFAPMWVCVRDEYHHEGLTVPTRLVVYEGGTKVDFALYAAADADDIPSGMMTRRALVDKDGIAPASQPQLALGPPPSEEEYRRVVEEFWFEAYHVAKYLYRNELWQAKARDWEMKTFLLTMIEWHACAKRGWDINTKYRGKEMASWVDEDVWGAIHETFARFDAEDSWSALDATMGLFRRIGGEVGDALGTTYPDDVDRRISTFVADLEQSAHEEAAGELS